MHSQVIPVIFLGLFLANLVSFGSATPSCAGLDIFKLDLVKVKCHYSDVNYFTNRLTIFEFEFSRLRGCEDFSFCNLRRL